uniref:Nuclear mitotic apparatus protein 1 n=1 Tax=Cyprinus carpio TaxID=7962 RepID=A0A8C1J146_CYPCA
MSVANSSSMSSGSSLLNTDDESPIVSRFQRPPRVQFQELCTVASSSDRSVSPVQDVMSTPHFQLKKLRKELAHEGDVRDELEKELADQISELEKDHKAALLELQEKNESLLHRVHEVLKQCQDLKTDNSQKERKIDELTEENGTLTAQVRNAFAQLARADEEVAKLTLAHELAQTEWKSRKEFLEKELNEADCLSEQVQILQGKISVLEDELQKAKSQEKGEVLGPILEWEKLKQELADLTLKLAQLQDTIFHLEKEKAEVEALLAEERGSFEKETKRLQMVVFDLEQSINSIRLERETLQEALWTQKEMLTAQISLVAEIKISADLRQQREELEGKVASLDKMVNALHTEIQGLEVERASQQDALNALIIDLQSARATIQEYEKKLEEHQKVVQENESLKKEQKQQLDECQQNLEMLRKERDHLSTQVSSLQEEICRSQQEVSVLQVDHNLLKENLAALQNQLVEVTTTVSQKESELLLLQQELSYQVTLREKALELETIKREEFEKKVSELQAKILEVSTLASQREAQVISLQNEMKDQQSLAKQSEEDLRRELEEKVGTLQGELDMVNRCAVDKEKLLGSLDQKFKEMEGLFLQKEKDFLETHQAKEELEKRIVELHVEKQELSECLQNQEILRKERDHLSTEVSCLKEQICGYQDTEVQKQQEISVLEAERNTFRENMDALEKKLLEETTEASQKQSELVLLKDKLHQLESLREKAQELETAKREELERMVSELQVKILEVSTLASEREACVNSLQDQLTDQLKAKQSEDDLRILLKEKVETLQGQLETADRDISDKDRVLQTLDQKLKQMDLLCQQREKDVHDMHQVKDNLEKKIGELVFENQQLLECQQNLEMVRTERDILSTEITSLKDEIQNYREIEVQKQQEISFLEAEHNTLKDNLAALKTQVVELTTTASQKESELLLLQKEVCDKENLKEKAQELEKDVSELQAKILEVSTLASEREVQISSLKNEINDQFRAKQSDNDLRRVLEEKIETLQKQLETTRGDITDKDLLLESLDQKLSQMKLNCHQKEKDVLEIQHSKEDLEKRIGELLAEHNTLKDNLAALKTQVVELKTTASQKESELLLLQKEVCDKENLKEKAQELEKDVSELQAKILEVSTLASERAAQISSLKDEISDQQLRAKQSEDDLRSVLEKKIETLQGQLETGSRDISDKDQLLQTLDQKLKQMDLLCQQREKDVLDMHQVKDDLEKKIGELVVEKHQLLECQQNLEMVRTERDILSTEINSLKDEIQNYRETEVQKQQEISFLEAEHNTLKDNLAALKTQVVELTATASQKESEVLLLQKEVCDKENLKEKAQELEKDVSELQAKILEVSTLSTTKHRSVLNHIFLCFFCAYFCMIIYASSLAILPQVEKAKNHYNGKKQLLVESQELNKTLEHSLEASKREVKALETELTLARMELDQASTKEKNLVAKVKSLEAQVSLLLNISRIVPEKQQDTSIDSLEFELNDSLNANSRSAVPGESSTPLVRSSERLAAKRRALGAESLETLYFTPLGQQGNMRKGYRNDAFEHKLESSITSIGDLVVDSAKKLTASARRRRTTQVINITMAKVGNAQPSPFQHSRPFSMDLSEESAAALSKADPLQSLPGYRRSAVHNVNPPRATSTFCIGSENEPEHASDDWMRIAELQARNKACLPHLKSSYPLESRPSLGPSFAITDEDLRMGDPDETIRRASMMPAQILESLNSRRFSLAPSSSQSSANSQPQRATMLPGQIRSSTAAHRSAQLTKTSSRASENKRSPLAPKRPGSQLQGPDTPEVRENKSLHLEIF